MKTTTHDSLHQDLAKTEKQTESPQKPDEAEITLWVMMAVLLALVVLFGYLFWNKF